MAESGYRLRLDVFCGKKTIMKKTGNRILVKTLWQILAIIAIGAVLGLITNALRPDSLQLIGDWSAESRITTATGQHLIISLSEAEKLFTEDTAIFIDARSNEDFRNGHIAGAKSLSWQDVDRLFVEIIEDISPDMTNNYLL